MNYSEKILQFFKEKDVSGLNFAKRNELSYTTMMANIREDKISFRFIETLVKDYPDVDLNWLLKDESDSEKINMVSEPHTPYGNLDMSDAQKIEKAIALLDEIRKNMSPN